MTVHETTPRTHVTRRASALLLCLVLAGCTRVVAPPTPRAEPVAPITAGQVGDLLSDAAKPEQDANLFATIDPGDCAGLAREVDPPFVFDVTPAAHDAGQSYAPDGRTVSVQEIVAVYRTDFDARAKLDEVRRTIDACRSDLLTATAMQGQEVHFQLVPPRDSGVPEIVLWSLAGTWACDDAFIAAHNAAVEITACGESGGYDVLPRAKEALQRIETLANTTA